MQPFVISPKGLATGRSDFNWHADGEFFGNFENTEILDADLQIAVHVDNNDESIDVKCEIDGTVVVACDRCLEDLTLPVHTSFEESDVLDLNQDIYDFVCISLPMMRVHEEGGCNEDVIKYLSK